VNVASGTAPWLAKITIAEGAFNSGDFVCRTDRCVEVDDVYTEGGACHADRKREGLPYQVEGVCPLVEKIHADARCPSLNFCNPNGTRTVSVVTNVTPANASVVVVVQW